MYSDEIVEWPSKNVSQRCSNFNSVPNKTLKGPVAIQIKDLEQYFTTPSDDSAVIFDDVSVKRET